MLGNRFPFWKRNKRKGLTLADHLGGAAPFFWFSLPVLFGFPWDELLPASPKNSRWNTIYSPFHCFECTFQTTERRFRITECPFKSIEWKNYRELSAFPIGCEKRFPLASSLFVGQPKEKTIPACSMSFASVRDRPRLAAPSPKQRHLSSSLAVHPAGSNTV